jgi:hypothetical protein
MAQRIRDHDHDAEAIEYVKVMETFHGPIDMIPLLRVLPQSHVTTLCLVGVLLEEHGSRLLARALCNPKTMLQKLQLCRLSRWGVSALAMALSFNTQLKELRVTFHHDVLLSSLYHFSRLTHAIQQNKTLQVFQLYCANLQDAACTQYLASMLEHNTSLRECRLTGCQLQELRPLAMAIHQSNTLERLDLSMNRMADTESLALLFDTPSLRCINLAENELGSLSTFSNHHHHRLQRTSSSSTTNATKRTTTTTPAQIYHRLVTALAKNTTLEFLSLDMNPLSQDFVNVLHTALQHNTALLRVCLLTISVPSSWLEQVEHLVALNRAGRGVLRQEDGFATLLMPQLLSSVSAQPTLLYGLLIELPHLWMPRC